MIIALVRFQPEFDETGILVGDESLGAHELILVPVEGAFEFAVLVQGADDEAVVVQVDAAVLHQEADASDVAPVVQPPSVAQLLAKDFRRRFEVGPT